MRICGKVQAKHMRQKMEPLQQKRESKWNVGNIAIKNCYTETTHLMKNKMMLEE